MPSRKLLLALPLAAGLVMALLAAQCFPRQCRTHENCLRECECTDTQRDQIFNCPMFFRCDAEAGYCSDEYNMSCDELCQRFAARSVCGTKTCDNEAECLRAVTCNAINPQTGQVLCTYNCDAAFACDAESGTCDVDFGQDDNTICAQFCAPPAGCGA